MQLRVLFVEQVSPEPELCRRCDMLHRDVVISAFEPFFAMIEDEEEMDEAPRLQLCSTCAFFVRDAMDEDPAPDAR